MDKGEVPLAIFIDLSNAFDTLDHDILLYKLKCYGLTGNSINLFKCNLTNRQQYVHYDNRVLTSLKCQRIGRGASRDLNNRRGEFVDTNCSEMHLKAFLYTLIHGSHRSLKTGIVRE